MGSQLLWRAVTSTTFCKVVCVLPTKRQSMQRKMLWRLTLVCALMSTVAPLAAAQITFESDVVGTKPNTGWQSSQSSDVTFRVRDELLGGACAATNLSSGCELHVYNWGVTGHALSGGYGDIRYSLDMIFNGAVNQVSFMFGGDDRILYAASGPFNADLTLFDDAVQVAQVTQAANGNDEIDQTIGYSGLSFNRANFRYFASAATSETIDNLTYTLVGNGDGGNDGGGDPVVTPEPGSMVLLATGLVGLVGIRRRRRSN